MKLLGNVFLAFALLGLAACGEGPKRSYDFNDGQKPAAEVEDPPKGPHPQAIIETSYGDITIELYEKAAPITVKNFIEYVKDEHYDNTIFHRVIEDFMIQGGGFSTSMKEKKTGDPIKNESFNGLKNKRGTLAMARTGEPHSATAQFFINVKDNGFLNKAEAQDGWGYAVFGRVIKGMDVVDEIRQVPTGKKLLYMGSLSDFASDVPLKNVKIHSVRMVEQKQEKEETKTEGK